MPTYRYRCSTCGDELEVWQSFTEEPLTVHADCGGELRKVLSPAGIVLKGSGFYKTDNRSGSNGKGEKKEKQGSDSSSAGSGSGSDSTKDSGSSSTKDGGSSGSGSSGSGSSGAGSSDSGSSTSSTSSTGAKK